MNTARDAANSKATAATRLETAVRYLLTGLPVASLAIMFMAWLRHGLDLPFRDDWREYMTGKIASLDWSHLFRSDNDTLSPVTRVLDALAQRYLDGNSVAYQALSMALVLGSLLWLQWKLLNKALADKFLVACAFSATLLMLQPESYWGHQNLAYIQALPLVFIVAALYVTLQDDWSSGRKAVAAFVLGLLSGLSYISGAFATLAMSLALLAMCVLSPKLRKTILAPAIGSLLSAVITVAMQAWVIVAVQHGKTHRADAPWALPIDADFWFYLFGKIGRSLMLPASWGAGALVLSGLAIVLLMAASIILLQKYRSREPRQMMGPLIAFILLVVVVVYLALVSAGRANLRPAWADDGMDIFRFGYQRFHFFWVTILWPWLIVLVVIASGAAKRRSRLIPGALAACIVAFVFWQGGFAHSKAFGEMTSHRLASDATCLRNEIAHGGKIECKTLAPYGDLSRAYVYAVRSGASFVRYFPPELAGTNTTAGPRFLKVLNDKSIYSTRNVEPQLSPNGALQLPASRDPMILFTAGSRSALNECLVLQVRARIVAAYADRAQFFYRTPDEAKFSEAHSIKVPIGKKTKVANFVVVSHAGFYPDMRLDPVANQQPSEVQDLAVRCLF